MNIGLIGSGNVATHLAQAVSKAGHGIRQVYSRSGQHAQLLADQVNAQAIDELNHLNPQLDLYIIAVKDSAIAEVASQLAVLQPAGIVVHTSGSTDIAVLSQISPRVGVLYPLQTFSKAQVVDFSLIPFLIEGHNTATLAQIEQLARSLSQHIYHYSSAQRRSFHLAAVLACNFSNYLYTVAHQYLEQQNVDFNLLKPLILETAQKVQQHPPYDMQTGPAVRHDQAILDMHLNMLADQLQLQQLYAQLSQGIMQLHVAQQ